MGINAVQFDRQVLESWKILLQEKKNERRLTPTWAFFARPKVFRSTDLEKRHAVAICSHYSWNKFVINIYWSGKQESRPPCFEV
jgi:hypothetical protein